MGTTIFELPFGFEHCVAMHLLICVLLWFLVISAIFIDLWDRIYTQKKTRKTIASNRMRLTLDKMSEYWRFMLIAFIIDIVIFIICLLIGYKSIPVVSIIFCICLLVIEVKSLLEHAKERKSDLVDMNELIQVVVNAASDRDAKKVIKDISEYLSRDKINKEREIHVKNNDKIL